MKNEAVLITGAAKRIGCEMALSLAAKGFDIAIHYHNSKIEAQKLADKIIKKFSVKAKIFQANLLDENSAKPLISKVLKEFPNLSLLINNASIFNQSKFLNSHQKDFSTNFNIHFLAPFILSQEFAKHVLANKIKGSHIINIIDKNIVRFDTNYFHYLLSKKFLAEFTKMLALELAPNIRVNGIAPGFILNAVNQDFSKEYVRKLEAKIPLQKKGDVKNICQTVEFLLENNFISGQIIFVDGAASLNHAG